MRSRTPGVVVWKVSHHIAGRMVRRHVEQLEVGQIVFDFAAAINLETHIGEDAGDAPYRLRGGVQPAARQRSTRQRHVERFGGQAALEGECLQSRGGFLRGGEKPLFDLIGLLSVGAALIGGQFADRLDGQLHLALVAEVFGVPGAQGGLVGAGLEVGQGTLFEGCEIGHTEARYEDINSFSRELLRALSARKSSRLNNAVNGASIKRTPLPSAGSPAPTPRSW